jgi:hypothetical protein
MALETCACPTVKDERDGEFAAAGHWVGRHGESLAVLQRLFEAGVLPRSEFARIATTLACAHAALVADRESGAVNTAGAAALPRRRDTCPEPVPAG